MEKDTLILENNVFEPTHVHIDARALKNLRHAGRWAMIVAYISYIFIMIQLIVEFTIFAKSDSSYTFIAMLNVTLIIIQFFQVKRLHDFDAETAHSYQHHCSFSVGHSFNEFRKYLNLGLIFIGLNILSKLLFIAYQIYLNNGRTIWG
jgi:hypothetical protein